MPETISKTQRWLDLIALLLGRQVPLGVEEIMERVPAYAQPWTTGGEKERASTRRKFERDKDELRGLGIPIETVEYSVNYGMETFEGYRITRRDFYLPYLRVIGGSEPSVVRHPGSAVKPVDLEPEEARIAFEALKQIQQLPAFPFAAEARAAYAKLAFDLDPEKYQPVPVQWIESEDAELTAEKLRTLSDALLARKRVRFRYHGIARDETTERDVAPYGLFFHRYWYLVGHDALRDAVRVFRLGRMEELQPNTAAPRSHDYSIPEDFDLAGYVRRRPWELEQDEDPKQVDVLFRFPATIWAEKNGEGEAISIDGDGSTVRRFAVNNLDALLRWVLSFAGEAVVVSPPAAVESFRVLAEQVATVHRGADG